MPGNILVLSISEPAPSGFKEIRRTRRNIYYANDDATPMDIQELDAMAMLDAQLSGLSIGGKKKSYRKRVKKSRKSRKLRKH